MSSSCFIRPKDFNKNSLSLLLHDLFHTDQNDDENDDNKSLNLNSPTVFYDANSHLDFNMNDEDSKYCFITFYTKSERLQMTQMNNINNEWENLNNKAKAKEADSCDNLNNDTEYIDTVIKPIKPKRNRALMDDLIRSKMVPINDQGDVNQDFDIIEEEEEELETDSYNYFNDYDEIDDDDIQSSRASDRYENQILQ